MPRGTKTTTPKTKKPRAPQVRCPHLNSINVVQFQLHDNGPKPGRGSSQHVMTVEVYCEGRLDLYRPYWKRAIPLIEPKLFFAWVERERAAGNIDEPTYANYRAMSDAANEIGRDDVEFLKFGHIGSSENGTTYYVGQYLFVLKHKGGGLDVVMNIDGGEITTDSFLYDKFWKPGGTRRKFFGFYDPFDMYGAAKRERAFAAQADNKAAALREAGE